MRLHIMDEEIPQAASAPAAAAAVQEDGPSSAKGKLKYMHRVSCDCVKIQFKSHSLERPDARASI